MQGCWDAKIQFLQFSFGLRKKESSSDMSFRKIKCSATYKSYVMASNNCTGTFPSDLENLQSTCVNADSASASTSNEGVSLSSLEMRCNEVLGNPDIKNNNKYGRASIILDTHDESHACKSISLCPQSNLQDFVSIELKRSGNTEREVNIRGGSVVRNEIIVNSRNEVPESCKLVTSQNAECRTTLIPESLNCNASDSINVEMDETNSRIAENSRNTLHNSCTIEDNVHLASNENIPDESKRDYQQGGVNDSIVSNNVSQRLNDDNILLAEVQSQNEIVREQYCTVSDQRTTAKYQETKENGVTALPAKSTRSLPSDLKVSIEDDEKSRLVKNKLPSAAQSFTERMQSTIADDAVQDPCTSGMKHDEQNQSFITSNQIKRKRGRPRKIIDVSIDQSTSKKSKDDDAPCEIPDTNTESATRNKRRTSKINITTSISDLSDESDAAEEKTFVKRRGRPPGSRGRGRGHGRGRGRGRGRGTSRNSLDTEYIPRLITKDASQLKTEGSNETDDTTATANHVANIKNAATASNAPNMEKTVQLVTCAKCNQEVTKKQWSLHNLHQHNNMAWQKDEEPLDFENDEKLLKRVLTSALKQRKKYLTCEECRTAKRSVIGFISHMQFCGKSEQERQALMVTCPICEAVMMPSSVDVHERYHRQLEQNKIKAANVQIEKTKRKAAERAVPKIQEFSESLSKGQNPCTNNIMHTSEFKKSIPSAWKVKWKKELASNNIASCKHLGCTFTCSSYETICEHYYQCNFAPQEDFMCKICKFSGDSQNKVVDHIMEAHPDNKDLKNNSDYETEEDEYSSDESITDCDVKQRSSGGRRSSKISSDSTRPCPRMAFLDKEPKQRPESTKAYKPTLNWTLDFELENYELALFKDDLPNCFTLLGNDDAAEYFPELTVSMAFKHVDASSSTNPGTSDSDDWKHLNRFEGDIYDAVPTFFVGGPVWALAWLPIPSPMYCKNPTQYVAISTHPRMESHYTVGKAYPGPNIIQIWDVGPLNHEVNSGNRSPVLAYAIAHNSGTIWCLEWCPSGCYQDIELGNYKAEETKLKRMGLLAAACSDGCVNIYSLPFADELKFERTESNSWPIYKTDPVMTLLVNPLIHDDNEQNWQCTKISWMKEHGHNFLAAGCTNGYIALWHLTTVSPLLLETRGNTKIISACKHLFAHYNAVTMVAFTSYGKGQFLASASVDRSYKLWNLEEIDSGPISTVKKGIIVNGAWMTNWPCAIVSFDDALGYQNTHTTLFPVREYGYKYCLILPTNSPTYGLAVSDYANGIAHGSLAGEVLTIFPHQLLYPDKILPKKRQLNSFIETVDLLEEQQDTLGKDNESKNDKKDSKEYHYMPETYNECKDRFGIVFHDNLTYFKKNISRSQKDTLTIDKLKSVPLEQYPFASANRMAWNPNAWSYLWLSVGYQNGLVRLSNFNSMSPRSLNTLLQAHVESVLAKKK